jgi:glyoxylase-like metal-dependent hydrolase (beta-lactamase superfamily II)
LAGIEPEQITDIILSHAHFDHIGGIDLFPKATLWIEKEEYSYYTGLAWQKGNAPRGIDRDDILHLVRCNLEGRLVLIDGDDREIFPGIRIYTGGKHTYASAFIRVAGNPVYVLASDNCYLYTNLETRSPVKTFAASDYSANLSALERMIILAGTATRVIPGHDALVFERFPTIGRIAKIR